MVSGENLSSLCALTPVLQVATCAGIARQRSTDRNVDTDAARKGIVQGTAWCRYLNVWYARSLDCPRRTGLDL
jgi:hypothetical protein